MTEACLKMAVKIDYQIGDIVRLKKKHPCGSFEWEILRTGADLKLKCLICGHLIMMDRSVAQKNTREVSRPGSGKEAAGKEKPAALPGKE